MAKEYLDKDGVLYFWQKIKTWVAGKIPTKVSQLTNDSGFTTNTGTITGVSVNGSSVATSGTANVTVPTAASATPKMDGTAAAGSESAFARGDHVHPTDTSRASASDLSSHTSNTTVHVTAAERSSWNAKQSALSFDSTPTANSTKPVTSGGVKSALDAKQNKLTFDSTPQGDSYNPVYSDGIYTALAYKQDELTFDSTPTANSSNPVTSEGVKSAIDTAVGAKQNKLTFDSTPTANSSNPVTSEGVKTAIDAVDAKFANKQNAIPNADKLSIDSSGIIAARNLPGYVDDVVEVYILADGSVSAGQDGWLYMEGMTKYLPIQNAKGKIYVVVGEIADVAVSVGSATDAGEYQNTQWRWTGSQYVRLADGSGVSPITNSEIDVIVAQ